MNTDRYVLRWHDRGPLRPLPVVADTQVPRLSEIFVSEDRARAEMQDRNARYHAQQALWAAL